MLTHWKREIPNILTAAKTGAGQFESTLLAMVRYFMEDANRARLMVREMLDRPNEMQEQFETHLQPWTPLVTDYIRRGQERGKVRKDVDPDSYVTAVITMAIGTLATGNIAASILGSRNTDIETQMQELVRIARVSLFAPEAEV